MNSRLADLLERLAPVVREEIRRDFLPNCCIATAAILRRVFRHFRFVSTPVPVEVVVRNPRMVDLFRRGCFPDGLDYKVWFKATGAYSVGIVRESPGEFAGHLVTQVQDVLVDASLDQCNRPDHGIELPSFMVTNIAPGFDMGRSQAGIVNGCEVLMSRLRGNSTWRTSRDWTNEDRARRAVNAIIERVRAGERAGLAPFNSAALRQGIRERGGDYARS